MEDSFSMDPVVEWFQDDSSALRYCVFYYYFIVIYNEIMIQLTVMVPPIRLEVEELRQKCKQ